MKSIQQTQARWKNKRTKISIHKIDDKIWLNVKNIRIKRNNKFEHRLFEFFEIIAIKDEFQQVYELKLSNNWNIHSIFHVFLLKKNKFKKKKNSTQSITISSKNINIDDDIKYVVNKFVDKQKFEIETISKQQIVKSSIYYLIDWKNYEKYDQTWEFYEHIAHLRSMLRRFHENWSNKSNDRSFTSIKRKHKRITFKEFSRTNQFKKVRKRLNRKAKAFKLISLWEQ